MARVRVRSSLLGSVLLAAAGMCWLCPAAIHAQGADEQEVRSVVQQVFTALERKDLGAMMALWSEKSPDLAASKQRLERLIAGVGQIELKSVSVDKLDLAGDKATVRVVEEMSALDAKTGKPAAGFGTLHRTLDLVGQSTTWKICRAASREEDLAGRI